MRWKTKCLRSGYLGLVVALACCCLLGVPDAALAQAVSPAAPALPVLSIEAGLELARTKTCLGCHQLDSKRVGPSFQAVAQRHGPQTGSLEYLASAIRQGGRGRWGAVPMPAQTQVSQQDALQLAQWILSLR
jgi:cytochrome c